MRKLQERSSASRATQSNSRHLQGSLTVSATIQSILEREERLPVVTDAAKMVPRRASATYPPFLRSALLMIISFFLAPFGYFEALSTFKPEEYTIHDMGHQIICYSSALAENSPNLVTVRQDLLVAKNRRDWIRMRLNTTVTVGTSHWKPIADYLQRQVLRVRWEQLPQGFISLIQSVMVEHPDISDDTEIDISYDEVSDDTVCDDYPKAISLIQRLDSNIIGNTWNRIESLRHQNVRIVLDTTLVKAYLVATTFVANLDGRWVLYRAVINRKTAIDSLWCSIQAGIALRGASHIAPFVGVVVDSDRRSLKGILVDAPPKGPMFSLMDLHRFKGKPIPWPIRQKWAKQIVRGVRAYHERSQVIGGLLTLYVCLFINEYDDAVIWSLSQGNHPAYFGGEGVLPPECRTEAFAMGDGQVGPEFDIFQLGGLLWHLYRDQHQQGFRTFCSLANCSNAKATGCHEHGDPIAMPKAAADVPTYLDRVITLCRQENPQKRPAAWELLQLFPTDEEISLQIDLLNTDERVLFGHAKLTRLEDIRDVYKMMGICDICRERIGGAYYTCSVCNSGNFDLCHTCFLEGVHCKDKAHLLTECDMEAYKNRDVLERLTYHSSASEEGKREVLVI
jgi:hypothetical protein